MMYVTHAVYSYQSAKKKKTSVMCVCVCGDVCRSRYDQNGSYSYCWKLPDLQPGKVITITIIRVHEAVDDEFK